MQQFYLSYLTKDDTEIHFDKTESKHLSRVLRKKVGDTIAITNGLGCRFTATLTSVDHKICKAAIVRCEVIKADSYHLHIFIAPTKSNDRMDWFVEKATEIGISEITPIISVNTEKIKLNYDRSNKLILSAMKQSLRYKLPILNLPTG